MMELLLQELLLTAFVALVFSFSIAKLVSGAVSAANGDFVGSGKKGIDEIVKLDRGLEVGGAKSKKRVGFAVDEVVENVEKFSGEEGLVGEVEEFCGNLEICLGEEIVEKGNLVNEELSRVIGSGGELGYDEIVDEQNEGVVRVLEEFGVEERREIDGSEGNMVDELTFTERNESEVGGVERSVRFISDVVTGDLSGVVRVVEDKGESRGMEGNLVNIALDELIVAEKNENADDDNRSVQFCGDDVGGGGLSGELKGS